jgi:hypothetical protein
MHVPHYAKRTLAALALSLLVAGCGGDSTAPDAPFDPAGTSSDMGAMQASFDSPAMAGYVAASGAITAALGETPAAVAVRVAPTKALVARGKPAAEAYVKQAAGMRPLASTAAAIPAEYLGVTFTYNVDADQYEPSDLTGAPVDGVRFIVYAINGISGAIIEPVVEVGYADITTTETTTSATVRIELVSADVTYLDYAVGITANSTGGTIAVSGFVSNGDDRVDFDLDTHVSSTQSTTQIAADYTLIVPTRGGFRIDFESEITLTASTTASTSTLEARGPHGTVTITGDNAGNSGTFEVEVNGELFASIGYTTGQAPVITGADGEPLTQAELEVLQDILIVFLQGADFFEDLFDPIAWS